MVRCSFGRRSDHRPGRRVRCQGAAGPPGASIGTLSGTVTSILANSPLDGVKVSFDPAQAAAVTTDASGKYSVTLPIGVYAVSYPRASFTAASQSASVAGGQTVTKDVALKPATPVVVAAGADQNGRPGGAFRLDAKAEVLDGSNVVSASTIRPT